MKGKPYVLLQGLVVLPEWQGKGQGVEERLLEGALRRRRGRGRTVGMLVMRGLGCIRFLGGTKWASSRWSRGSGLGRGKDRRGLCSVLGGENVKGEMINAKSEDFGTISFIRCALDKLIPNMDGGSLCFPVYDSASRPKFYRNENH